MGARLNIGQIISAKLTRFTEDFESGWFTSRDYTSVYTEDFESGWFTSRDYTSVYTEDFEDGGW